MSQSKLNPDFRLQHTSNEDSVMLFSTDLICFLGNAMKSREMLVRNPLIQSNIQHVSLVAEYGISFETLPVMKIV